MVESLTVQNKLHNKLLADFISVFGQNPPETLILSISGGADSVFAFHFLVQLVRQFAVKLVCVHFNHGLRGDDSDKDQEFCEQLCHSQSIPIYSYSLDLKSCKNLQSDARSKRYEKLKWHQRQYTNAYIVTAHNRNDSVESFFVTLHQGRMDSRLYPLSILSSKHKIYRPLVGLTKTDIVSSLRTSALDWREDVSNESQKYLRNYYRKSFFVEGGSDNAYELGQRLAVFEQTRDCFYGELCKAFKCDLNQEVRISKSVFFVCSLFCS